MLIRIALLVLVVWLVWRWLTRPRTGASAPRSGEQQGDRDPWTVLGVDRNASESEIRRAFHRRMSEYHPDKVRELGADLRELAEARSREITRAYQLLRKD